MVDRLVRGQDGNLNRIEYRMDRNLSSHGDVHASRLLPR